MTSSFKKDKKKLDLSTVEKSTRERICHSIYQYAKSNNKYMKEYEKKKKSSYLQYWNVNILYGWAILQKIPINNFEWIEDASQFNKAVIKNYNEKSDKGYFLEVDVHSIYQKITGTS